MQDVSPQIQSVSLTCRDIHTRSKWRHADFKWSSELQYRSWQVFVARITSFGQWSSGVETDNLKLNHVYGPYTDKCNCIKYWSGTTKKDQKLLTFLNYPTYHCTFYIVRQHTFAKMKRWKSATVSINWNKAFFLIIAKGIVWFFCLLHCIFFNYILAPCRQNIKKYC